MPTLHNFFKRKIQLTRINASWYVIHPSFIKGMTETAQSSGQAGTKVKRITQSHEHGTSYCKPSQHYPWCNTQQVRGWSFAQMSFENFSRDLSWGWHRSHIAKAFLKETQDGRQYPKMAWKCLQMLLSFRMVSLFAQVGLCTLGLHKRGTQWPESPPSLLPDPPSPRPEKRGWGGEVWGKNEGVRC